MERIAGHYDKIVLTLIMCLVILFMATFSPLAESTNAVGVIAPAIIAIIIAGLAAVGITFVTTGAYDNLSDYVESLFSEYAQIHNTTPNALLKGTQSGTDKLGRILINNHFVQLISLFGAWLIQKFSLANNSTISLVSPGTSIGNLSAYQLPFTAWRPKPSLNDGQQYNAVVASDIAYAILYYVNASTVRACIVSEIDCYVQLYDVSSGGSLTPIGTSKQLSFVENYNTYFIDGWTAWTPYTYSTNGYDFSNYVIYDSFSTVTNALASNSDITTNYDSIILNTGDITLPLDDDSYTDGDGAIIDLGADWGLTYTDVTEQVIPDDFSDSKEGEATIEYVAEEEVADAVEDTSEITNLPAGTIPFTPLQLPQFHLVDIWHYVAQWISDTAIAAGALMAIVVQEPTPLVNLFYATVCLAIIFGLIKGLAK